MEKILDVWGATGRVNSLSSRMNSADLSHLHVTLEASSYVPIATPFFESNVVEACQEMEVEDSHYKLE